MDESGEGSMSTRQEVFDAIGSQPIEPGMVRTLNQWIDLMDEDLAEAYDAMHEQDHNDARRYILRLIAVCVAALEQHGVEEAES